MCPFTIKLECFFLYFFIYTNYAHIAKKMLLEIFWMLFSCDIKNVHLISQTDRFYLNNYNLYNYK